MIILITTSLDAHAQNLLNNGNFEQGNGVGFSSNYGYIPSATGSTGAGQYGVDKNPFPYNTSSFDNISDHTSGTGNMLFVDGTNTNGNPEPFFWMVNNNGEICGLEVGKTYTFSYWIKSIYKPGIAGASVADVRIKWNNINGQPFISPVSGTTLAPAPGIDWQKVTYNFVPTNACVRIEMYDQNGSLAGNDFALDDIELLPPPVPLDITYSLTDLSCPGTNNGSLVAYGIGGIQPYKTFALSGTTSSTNTNGIFTNLPPGTYSVSVTDQNNDIKSVSGLVINSPTDLSVGTVNPICKGASVQLNVSNGSSYTWSSNPNDPTLTNTTINNPTVSPAQTTVYTVTAQTSATKNLIFNGDFSLGNIGFSSDYKYLNPTNVSGIQKAYGIVTNPNTWFNTFANCPGNNMMVVDGSAFNAGNDKVWSQTVTVTPNQSYQFSYSVQTVVASNFANLEIYINGVKIGGNTAPTTTCSWVPYTYTWNSGANTTAQIVIYDRTISVSGNDFALDNLSFSTTINCTLSKDVTVTVNNCSCPIQLTKSSTDNTNCNPAPCTYNGKKVVINELLIQPASGSNQIIRKADLTLGAEWLELYNPNPCQAVDLSCHMIGNYSTENSTVFEPAILFFPPGTTIPPLGFLSIGGPESPATLKAPALANGLVGNRFYLPGGIFDGGWVGIWDEQGVPIDAVYWLDASRNINSAVATGSFTVSPGTITAANVPFSCPYRGTLQTARQMASGSGPIARIGNVATNGQIRYRNPDGATTWVFNGTANTINTCNATCTTPSGNACNGTATVVATGGLAPYTYKWNDPKGQTTATATGLCAGNYCVDVKDANNACVANICVTVNDNCCVTINGASPDQSICASALPSAFTVNTSATGNNAITFKYYTTQQSGTAMYTGGNTLGSATPSGGTASYTPLAGTFPSGSGIYYVYAVLSNPPADPSCRPFDEIIVTINDLPTVTVNNPSACTGASANITATPGTNGTYSYAWTTPTGFTNPGNTGSFSTGVAGTYTVVITNTANNCKSNSASGTLTLSSSITPTFAQIGPVCLGSTQSPLPSTSSNNINGVWNPAFINTATLGTTTYYFAPLPNQCASSTPVTMDIEVTNQVPTTFNPIADICVGSTAPSLPAASIGGVTGNWNPAVISTATIGSSTYTFSPNPNQCAANGTLTVNVIDNVVPTFNPIVDICLGAVAPLLPAASKEGISGSWNPSTIDNTSGGTYVFTPTPVSGKCYQTASINISVNTNPVTPIFDPIPPVCINTTPAPTLPSISKNGIKGTWIPSAVDNQNDGIYTFSPDPNQCAESATLNITVALNPAVELGEPSIDILEGESVTLDAIVSGTNDYVWTPTTNMSGSNTLTPVVSPETDITYTLKATTSEGCVAEDSVRIIVLTDLIIPNIFSPNGDGTNDRFVIGNIEKYKNATVEIFNRYGQLLKRYEGGYPLPWDGKVNGKDVPDGTYFYIITPKSGKRKVISGGISIVR